jgi:hypothetical protein
VRCTSRAIVRTDHLNVRHTMKVFGLICSVAIQQLVFIGCLFGYFTLRFASVWVVQVPIYIFWALWFVAPLIFERPFALGPLLRSYAGKGWLFSAAGMFWIAGYCWYSERLGIPVSWTAVEPYFDSQRPFKAVTNVPNQSTDPTLSSGTPPAGQESRHP